MEQRSREERLLQILKQLDFQDINEKNFFTEFNSIFNSNHVDPIVVSQKDLENGGDLSNDYYFIIYDPREEGADFESIKNQLIENIQKIKVGKIQKVHLVEVFDSIKKRAEINNLEENRINKLRNLIRNKINERNRKKEIFLSNIEYSSFVVPKEISKKTKFEIKIKDRVRSLEQSYRLENKENIENESELNSYVVTAELDSLMDLYNSFGDQLFAKNVRVGGITDSLGVEDAIQNTYSFAPEEFWFLNNGISLLIASESDLNMDVYDRVRFSMDNLHDISIINGAQTIKAVSEVCYSRGSESESRDNWKPLVILRIYHYKVNENKENSSSNDLEAYKNFSEKVTISLNKQKPIRQSDLAYLTNFVKNIQNIRHNAKNEDIENLTFDFVRQGEIQSTVLRQYQLDVFAKVVKSYLLKQPGSARTQSYNSLLATKMVNNIVKLNDKNIFKEELQKDLERDKTKVFLKYYSPVNFAMRLKKYFETDSKFEEIIDKYIKEKCERYETKEGLKSFAKYGSLVMISAVINSINNFKDSFEEWKFIDFGDKTKDISKDIFCKKELDELIKRILDYFVKFVNTTEEDITESNFWKKDIIIEYILEQMRGGYDNSHFNTF